jgi:hypothetical protein
VVILAEDPPAAPKPGSFPTTAPPINTGTPTGDIDLAVTLNANAGWGNGPEFSTAVPRNPVDNKPKIFFGSYKYTTGGGHVERNGVDYGRGMPDPRVGKTEYNWKTFDEALNEPLNWSPKKLAKEIARAKKFGYEFKDGGTLDSYLDVWKTMVGWSQRYASAGKKVTPFDALEMMRNGVTTDPAAQPGPGQPGGGPITQVNRSIDEIDRGQAASIIETALTSFLGRAATDEEKDDFLSRANGIARRHPTINTQVREVDETGALQTTDSHTTGGVSEQMLQQTAEDQAKAKPEYGTYQAAARILPMIFQALDSPV